MPGFNRKGPKSEGPMTGRAMGRCANGRKKFDQSTAENDQVGNENLSAHPSSLGKGRMGGGLGLRQGRCAGYGHQAQK